jgi:acyl-CoA thioester hydrolase
MQQDPRLALSTYPLVTEFPLRYGDVDRQGHLNNVTIAALYQEARLNLLTEALGPITERSRIMVAEQTIRFLHEGFAVPTLFGSGVSRTGRSSYYLAHGMFQNGRCVGLCDSVLVNVGEDGRSAPLPDHARQAFDLLMLRLD